MRDLMQSDGIHPNAAGVAKIVEGMGPKVLELLDTVGAS
jgi:acyl-CoA thioesterase I